MTDLNTLRDMLERSSIPYLIRAPVDEKTIYLTIRRGYSVLVTSFEFDEHGKLYDIGAYE